jgi:hypothetical protein
MENSPKRNGPAPPYFALQSHQMASMRATLAAAPRESRFLVRSTTFIVHSLRRSAKPACISLLTERAWARTNGSRGQRCFSGNRSARVSQMASDSQTGWSPRRRSGTRPEGEPTCSGHPSAPK